MMLEADWHSLVFLQFPWDTACWSDLRKTAFSLEWNRLPNIYKWEKQDALTQLTTLFLKPFDVLYSLQLSCDTSFLS